MRHYLCKQCAVVVVTLRAYTTVNCFYLAELSQRIITMNICFNCFLVKKDPWNENSLYLRGKARRVQSSLPLYHKCMLFQLKSGQIVRQSITYTGITLTIMAPFHSNIAVIKNNSYSVSYIFWGFLQKHQHFT